MTELSNLLNQAKGDHSVDSLITEAERRHGIEIATTARSNIYKALKGDHAKKPHESTLDLFAKVFGLNIQVVRRAVNLPAGELGPYKPTDEAARLSHDQRRAIDALIKTIVQGGATDASAAQEDESDSSPTNVVDVATRRTGRQAGGQTKKAARRVGRPPKHSKDETKDPE